MDEANGSKKDESAGTNLEQALAKIAEEQTASPPGAAMGEEFHQEVLLGLMAFFRNAHGAKLGAEVLDDLARKKLGQIKSSLVPPSWPTARYCDIENVQRLANLHQPVRVVAHIDEISDPASVQIVGEDGQVMQVETISLGLLDSSGDSIAAVDAVGSALVTKLKALARSGKPCELLGTSLALPTKLNKKLTDYGLNSGRDTLRFFVHDGRPSDSAMDFLHATSEERSLMAAWLTHLRGQEKSPREAIAEYLVAGLQIVGLSKFQLMGDLLEITTLQALSCGRVGLSPGRLHLIAAGPPGHGKKILGVAARIQNPACEELSPSKTSVAGLVGAAYKTDKGWTSKPGALARAAEGVVLVQDAHGWSTAEMAKFGPVLQELMEDGRVRDSKAGGLNRDAPAALLIDLNRHAHLGVVGGSGPEAAILRLRPILSRADLLVDIPTDVKRIWDVSSSMLDSLGNSTVPLERQEWVRHVRLLVAALRDRHPTIDLGPVSELMKTAFNEIRQKNEALFESRPETGDVPARLTITFQRLVTALARSRDASVANAGDVARAVHFIGLKLAFLKMAVPTLGHAANGTSLSEFLSGKSGVEISPSEVVELYLAASGITISEKTALRHLQRIGATKVSHGRYLVPK